MIILEIIVGIVAAAAGLIFIGYLWAKFNE